MKTVSHEGNQYVLRFERSEEVIAALKQFCQQEKIDSGFFQGLGACSYLKLAYYDLKNKKYLEKEFARDLEIANVSGNVAIMNGDLIIHMHGTFSNENMKALGGHVMSMKAGGTCEMTLTKYSNPMVRKFDEDSGLKLLE
ncbi:MAG: DNA-binding protein [Candidatus Doudnabacteria bacterium]|nr:DNA-binding protein [Candidatus Doudnabacteria bacterium]